MFKPLALSVLTALNAGTVIVTGSYGYLSPLGIGACSLVVLNLGAYTVQSWINYIAKVKAELASGELEWAGWWTKKQSEIIPLPIEPASKEASAFYFKKDCFSCGNILVGAELTGLYFGACAICWNGKIAGKIADKKCQSCNKPINKQEDFYYDGKCIRCFSNFKAFTPDRCDNRGPNHTCKLGLHGGFPSNGICNTVCDKNTKLSETKDKNQFSDWNPWQANKVAADIERQEFELYQRKSLKQYLDYNSFI